jgi:hypothetical protein
LVGLNADDVVFGASITSDGYQTLTIRIIETEEILTVLRGADATSNYGDYTIQAVEFADGTTIDYATLLKDYGLHGTAADETIINKRIMDGTLFGEAGNDNLHGNNQKDALFGGAGDDNLYGYKGDDILDGGPGNDYLEGGTGNDIFVFGVGYGNDTINAYDATRGSRYDIIRLQDLNADDVVFGVSIDSDGYQNLTISIIETTETLTVLHGTDYETYYTIQAVEFADGTSIDYATLLKDYGLHGTANDETITNKHIMDGTIYGDAGNDNLHGNNQKDALCGGAGNDNLYGYKGDDILDGGPGNDYLEGGTGNDTYIFGIGDGQDTINNNYGGNDLLVFNDLDPIDLWFDRSGNNLILGLVGTQDNVTITNWFSGDFKIDVIQTDSMILLENQLSQLLQAMAALGTPSGANGLWTEEQQQELTSIISTYWQTPHL